jgi:two-component system, chemotaxis family, sensor kinase CheA
MISKKYKELYVGTAQRQLQQLVNFLLSLEKRPNSKSLIENIFRLVHSMKGAAATVAGKKTVRFYHTIENIIDAAYHDEIKIDGQVIDVLLKATDALQDNFESILAKGQEANFIKVLNSLNVLIKKRKITTNRKTIRYKKGSYHFGNIPSVGEVAVAINRLDKLQYLMDDLSINSIEAKKIIHDINNMSLLSIYAETDKIVSDLRHELEKLRLVPLSLVFTPLPYLVRDICRDTGKKVDFHINDNNLSLDKFVVDEILEVIVQLIKNAVVHGIDSKQKDGEIDIEVNVVGDTIQTVVRDNGRGIDWDEIINNAIKSKIISKAVSKKLNKAAKEELLFSPGISQAKHLTTIAGRGVGLSLVRQRVEELDGEISIKTSPDKGTTFVISLPMPMSVFKSLIFKIKDYEIGVPSALIKDVVKLEQVKDFSKAATFSHDNKKYKVLKLDNYLDLVGISSLCKYVVLFDIQDKKIAVPICGNIKTKELIMKKTPKVLRDLDFIKGVAVSAEGHPILVLDINNLI